MDKIDKATWVNTLWEPLEEMYQSPLYSKKEGIRVAAYCRVSLDSHNMSQSLESQVSHYTHVISDRPNWKFVGIYFDNLVSGRKAGLRHGFTRMLRHCEEGRIDLILVKNVSRFSRNTKDLIEVVERLKELKVGLYFETENIDITRPETTYLLKTYASIAQGVIEEASQSIEWGHEKRMLNGNPIVRNLFGYNRTKTDSGKILEIDEEQAKVIQEIYQMYLDGMTFNKIATELMQRKIKTYYGRDTWCTTTVRSILTNLSYVGDSQTRKTTLDMLSNKRRSSAGIRDQYLILNSHPAIISHEIFEQVQEIINTKEIKPLNREKKPNPFSKRIRCGNCNSNFRFSTIKPWNYLKCQRSSVNQALCASPTIRIDALKNMMLRAFEDRFDSEDPNIIRVLNRILITINRNDHFEFHRLKALTQIQLAKKLRGNTYTDEDIRHLEVEYQKFEENLIKIEEDRQYRLKTIEWLDTIDDFKDFTKEASAELMRAWIFEIVVFSKEDFRVRWIDEVETEIGNCKPKKPPTLEFINDEATQEQSSQNIKTEEILNIASVERGDIRSNWKEEEINMVPMITTIDDSVLLMKNIKRQLNGPVTMQSSVPAVVDKKLKVAAYVRVSTEHEQQELSLKTQYSYFLYLILSDPRYTLAGIYMDDGKSGRTTDGRKEFNRMIEDCMAGKIDLIITKSITRFSRNTVDTLSYIRQLQDLNPKVNIWFQKENIYSLDTRSSLLISLLSALGQEESVNIGESIAWGKRNLAKRGIVSPGRVGYGYEVSKTKDWIIKEDEAVIVRRIYKEYEEGGKVKVIARSLSGDNIPTPGGQKRWCEGTIRRILSAEIYRGNYIFQRYYRGDKLKADHKKNNGELPQYFIEKHHEEIIDDEQWQTVQKMILNRELKRTEKFEKFTEDLSKNESFSKKIFCEKCGNYYGYVRTVFRNHNNLEQRLWRCNTARKGLCDSKSLSQEYIEDNFTQLLMEIKFNDQFKKYLDVYIENLRIKPDDQILIDEYERIKEDLNQQLYKAVADELGKSGKDPHQVESLIGEIMEIREKLSIFIEREEQLELVAEETASLLKELEKYTDSTKDDIGYYINAPEFQKDLFERFIEKGTAHDDGSITFQFKSGFSWTAQIGTENYVAKYRRRKAEKRALAKEEFLRGPEVRRLLEFCRKPKTITEMHCYFGKYYSNDIFKRIIVTPLIGKGVIKQTMINGGKYNRHQKYYSVDIEF